MEDCISVVYSFLPDSGKKLLSMTCTEYLKKYHSNDTLKEASMKCDDVCTYNNYCLKSEGDIKLVLKHGAWNIYMYLGGNYTSRKHFNELRVVTECVPDTLLKKELDISSIWHEKNRLIFALNVILVEQGVRNAFHCDLFSKEYTQEFLLKWNVPEGLVVCGRPVIVCQGRYTPLLRDAIYSIDKTEREIRLGECLGYGYIGPDFNRETDMYIVSFNLYTQEGSCNAELYCYNCPIEQFTDAVKQHNEERVININRVLMTLGYCVKLEIIKI